MRLIDADRIDRNQVTVYDYKDQKWVHIWEIPTVDAVPVRHGHWEVDEDGNIKCSECGHRGVGDNYCERCGAKMDGEKREDAKIH